MLNRTNAEKGFGVDVFTIWERAFQKVSLEEAKQFLKSREYDVYCTDDYKNVIRINNFDEINWYYSHNFYFAIEIDYENYLKKS